MTAPWAFALLGCLLLFGAWKVASFFYNQKDEVSQRHIRELEAQVAGGKARADQLQVEKTDLLDKLGDQAEHGRIAALPVGQLRQRAIEFVGEAREWLEKIRGAQRAYIYPNALIPREQWPDQTMRKHQEYLRQSDELWAEWDRNFKMRSIVLRDEMLKHLPDQLPGNHPDNRWKYEHPTNPIGATEVVDDIERLAMLLT